VRFRSADGQWHLGVTESVSKSGILLRAEESLEPDTPIEMELELPQIRGEETAGRVICRGRVVRSDLMSDDAPGPGIVAATIAQYHFTR
jgi:PilZ domain-containing protein